MYRLSIYGKLCPIYFSKKIALVAPYLCYNFHIFDKPILGEYVFHVKRGPHLFQSCLNVAQDGLPFAIRGMHPSFNNLVVISSPGL